MVVVFVVCLVVDRRPVQWCPLLFHCDCWTWAAAPLDPERKNEEGKWTDVFS